MTRVETAGSIWLFDGQTRYLRMPREERPRGNGWGGPHAGPLQDLIWHDCLSWAIEDRIVVFDRPGPINLGPHLKVHVCDTADEPIIIYAPHPQTVTP